VRSPKEIWDGGDHQWLPAFGPQLSIQDHERTVRSFHRTGPKGEIQGQKNSGETLFPYFGGTGGLGVQGQFCRHETRGGDGTATSDPKSSSGGPGPCPWGK